MKWMALAVIAGVSLGLITACGGDSGTTRLYDADGGLVLEVSYTSGVYPILVASCMMCHESNVPAFVLTGDASADYDAVASRISTDSPADSKLLKKPTGQVSHDGGDVLEIGSDDYDTILDWIEGDGLQ